MVPDGAASCRAQNCMMASHVAGNGTDGGTLDATFRLGRSGGSQQRRRHKGCGQRAPGGHSSFHTTISIRGLWEQYPGDRQTVSAWAWGVYGTEKASSTLPAVAALPTA